MLLGSHPPHQTVVARCHATERHNLDGSYRAHVGLNCDLTWRENDRSRPICPRKFAAELERIIRRWP
jgi:hypothetical protein